MKSLHRDEIDFIRNFDQAEADKMILEQTKALLNFAHKNNLGADRKFLLDSIYKEHAGIWPYSIFLIPFEYLNFTAS